MQSVIMRILVARLQPDNSEGQEHVMEALVASSGVGTNSLQLMILIPHSWQAVK
jgi:hypothetical protein